MRLGHVVMRVGGVGVGAVLPGLGGLCAGGLGGLAGALGVLPQIAGNGGVFAALDGVARLFPLRKGVDGQAALGGHDGLRLCLGVNAVCDCLIDDDLVVSHGENLQNIFY